MRRIKGENARQVKAETKGKKHDLNVENVTYLSKHL